MGQRWGERTVAFQRNDLKASGAVPVNPAQTNVYQEHEGAGKAGAAAHHRMKRQYLVGNINV